MKRLELAALDSAMHDYESVGTVQKEIAVLLQQPVSAEDLFETFIKLASQGLVRGHVLIDDQWKVISPSEMKDSSAVWFLTTKEGEAVVERKWDQYFKQ